MKAPSKELKACPFCGGEAELMNDDGMYWVRCKDNCCCYTLHLPRAEVVASKWNRRVSVTQINHPDYYNSGGIEVADFIDANGLNFNKGNVIKYVARAGKKQGEDALTALLKAQWYLSREIIRAGHEKEMIEGMLYPLIHKEAEE